MIAVLGSELDEAAVALVRDWSHEGAVLVSARDLCTRGWVYHATGRGADGSFVAGGVVHAARDLRGVVVRRPAVAGEELRWIAPEDRQYVAAELNAFLVAWLSGLPCPVLNRPTPTSLCGPGWSQTYWRAAAERAGIPWAAYSAAHACREVVVCGDFHAGGLNARQQRVARQLAAISGAELLGVRFVADAVAAVTAQPSLADRGARDIVLARLSVSMPR